MAEKIVQLHDKDGNKIYPVVKGIDLSDAYVKKSGSTMTGNLTVPTVIGNLQGNASTATNASYLNNVSGHGVSLGVSGWSGTNPWGATNLTKVWGQSGRKSSLSGDTADIVLNYGNSPQSGGAGWYMCIDGGIFCVHGIYGAVWNDYAEFRICNEEFKPGQVVLENGDDTLSIASQRLQRGCSIVSDTFGFAIGETDEAKCPIAVSGRVLAYGYESREEFKKHIGWPVGSGPNGTVSIMTEEEEEKYPSRIIGTISAVPDYEIWGTGNVEVNNRIWIKVK